MHTLLWHLCIKINFFSILDYNIFDRIVCLLFMLYTQDSFLAQITQIICNILSLILFSNFQFSMCHIGLIYMRFWFLISKAKELD